MKVRRKRAKARPYVLSVEEHIDLQRGKQKGERVSRLMVSFGLFRMQTVYDYLAKPIEERHDFGRWLNLGIENRILYERFKAERALWG